MSAAAVTPRIEAQPANTRSIISTSPATGRRLGEVQAATLAQVKAAMDTARLARDPWLKLGLARRLRLIRNFKYALYRNLDLIADTLVAEQGRPPFEVMLNFGPPSNL